MNSIPSHEARAAIDDLVHMSESCYRWQTFPGDRTAVDPGRDSGALPPAATAESLADGFERAFLSFVTEFGATRTAGATESDIRKALQAHQKSSGVRHIAASAGACSLISSVAGVAALSGDLPDGFVFRPDTNGAVGLREGEKSLHALVRRLTTVGGKSAVSRCISDAGGTKAGFVTAAQAVVARADGAGSEIGDPASDPRSVAALLESAAESVALAATDKSPILEGGRVEALISAIRASLVDVEDRVAANPVAAAG